MTTCPILDTKKSFLCMVVQCKSSYHCKLVAVSCNSCICYIKRINILALMRMCGENTKSFLQAKGTMSNVIRYNFRKKADL